MPKLSELTDAYTPQETLDSLPVENPFVSVPVDADGVRRVRIDTVAPKQEAAEPGIFSQNADKFINALFRDDDKRYQLWPERMVREGLSAAGDVMSGKVPQWEVDAETGDVHTSLKMIEKAQEMSALAGTGGLAGMTTDATLGATPFLRPALKYKDKLYKGKDGQQHMDVIPASIYPEFQRQAMSGEDISNFQFGFVNEKGHFLDREKALKHAIDTGLVDPQAAQYGALTAPVLERMQNNGSMSVYPDKGFSGGGLNNILTTQLLADSSKPGIAIEAMKGNLSKEDAKWQARGWGPVEEVSISDLKPRPENSAMIEKLKKRDADAQASFEAAYPGDKYKPYPGDARYKVDEMRAAIQRGDKLPPIAVRRDGVIEDGENRWNAFKAEGIDKVLARRELPPEGYQLKPVDFEPDFGDKKK